MDEPSVPDYSVYQRGKIEKTAHLPDITGFGRYGGLLMAYTTELQFDCHHHSSYPDLFGSSEIRKGKSQ